MNLIDPNIRKSGFRIYSLLIVLFISGMTTLQPQTDYPTLEIGGTAPDFSLPGIDGEIYTLDDFKSDILVIIFTCNHCPTAQTYEDRIIKLVDTYSQRGVDFVAISPNDPQSIRLDELGYTDLGDELVEINFMYRHRNFELITISADNPDKDEQALEFLRNHHASCNNYLFNSNDKYALIEAVDPNWQGALPYSLLVKPGGELLYAAQGAIDPLEMKRKIVKVLGRYKDW